MHYEYKTENTCSTLIEMDIDGGVVSNIKFTGGCNGNLKAIPVLVDGMKAEDIAARLSGITCGRRPTSCSDQLAKAVLAAQKAEREYKKA